MGRFWCRDRIKTGILYKKNVHPGLGKNMATSDPLAYLPPFVLTCFWLVLHKMSEHFVVVSGELLDT